MYNFAEDILHSSVYLCLIFIIVQVMVFSFGGRIVRVYSLTFKCDDLTNKISYVYSEAGYMK